MIRTKLAGILLQFAQVLLQIVFSSQCLKTGNAQAIIIEQVDVIQLFGAQHDGLALT